MLAGAGIPNGGAEGPGASLSVAKSRNLESAAPKKGSAKSNTSSRRKVPSIAATPKKPPRSVDSKPSESPPAKHLVKIDKPKVERAPSRSACSPC